MNLFLDDIRDPYDKTWIVVRDYKAFVKFIDENGMPDIVSLDHDLSMEHYFEYIEGEGDPNRPVPYTTYNEKTGLDCARYLLRVIDKQGVPPPLIIIHSLNPVGAMNIANELRGHCRFIIDPYRPCSSNE